MARVSKDQFPRLIAILNSSINKVYRILIALSTTKGTWKLSFNRNLNLKGVCLHDVYSKSKCESKISVQKIPQPIIKQRNRKPWI